MEAVTIVMGLLRVVGNRAIKKMSFKIEKLFQHLTLSAVPFQKHYDSISDEEYSLISLEFKKFTRMKEDRRIKSKTSLEKTGNIETEIRVLFIRNMTTIPT